MQVKRRAILISMLSALLAIFGTIFSGVLATSALAENVKAEGQQPMLVFVHSMQCSVCAKVRPLIEELEKEYKGKVQFVSLDVTDDAALKVSRKKAKSLGITSFLTNCEDQFPCVGIFKTKEKLLKEMYGAKNKDAYVSGLNLALEK